MFQKEPGVMGGWTEGGGSWSGRTAEAHLGDGEGPHRALRRRRGARESQVEPAGTDACLAVQDQTWALPKPGTDLPFTSLPAPSFLPATEQVGWATPEAVTDAPRGCGETHAPCTAGSCGHGDQQRQTDTLRSLPYRDPASGGHTAAGRRQRQSTETTRQDQPARVAGGHAAARV